MTPKEALSYIENRKMGLKTNGLQRIRLLMRALGDPQDSLHCVHVAGTNGKGSTCAMLDSILRCAGYKTGLFTSPYLSVYNERIKINGENIPDGKLADITEEVKAAADGLGVEFTEFEIDTAIGFEYFAREKCDIAVVEVGLGGRFDPTNVISCPEAAVICNIGLDHTKILGDTPEKIAAEKAGIIKPGCCVAVYDTGNDAVTSVIAAACREKGVGMRLADFDKIELRCDDLNGQRFCYCGGRELCLNLLGDHQLKNAAVALETVEILREGGRKISEGAVEAGLESVFWPARFELVNKKPPFIVDGGHNPQCAEAAAKNIDCYFSDIPHVLLLGIMADKDVKGFLEKLAPVGDAFVCVTPNSPRAMRAEELGGLLKEYGRPVFVRRSIEDGVRTALSLAKNKTGMACAVGSLYMAGEVRAFFGLNTGLQ